MCDPNPLLSAVQRGNGQDPADKTQSPEAQSVSYGTRNEDVIEVDDSGVASVATSDPQVREVITRDQVVSAELLMVGKISAQAAILFAHATTDEVSAFAMDVQERADALCALLVRQHMYDRNMV